MSHRVKCASHIVGDGGNVYHLTPDIPRRHQRNASYWRQIFSREDSEWIDPFELLIYTRHRFEDPAWWPPFSLGDPDRLRFSSFEDISEQQKARTLRANP